jgi:hypothetical protein
MNFNDNLDALTTIRFVNGTNRSIFLTGKAGTGKTTLLRNIVQNTHKNTIIVAPTGIAALNAGGVTIHSMFQVPFGAFVPATNLLDLQTASFQIHTLNQLPKKVQLNSAKRNMILQLELLIIDEVSMLRADLLDAIDTILRYVRRKRNQAFGGVQVLFIGDMLQLPPIVKDNEWSYLKQFYKSMYFFDAQVFAEQKPIVIELGKIYRQSDLQFVSILNNLRNNVFEPEDIRVLNSHYQPNFKKSEKDSYIFLTTHNRKADAINSDELRKLKSETFTYKAEISDEFPEHIYPIEYSMELKEGSQIMFIKNDYSGGQNYYNGKIGKIHKLTSDSVQVIFSETGNIVNVDKYTWENKRFVLNKTTGLIEETTNGTFTHFPLKLAWAVTVHKSQGLTFKQAIIDVSEAFAPGQIYVALSRLESLEGLVLSEKIIAEAPEQSARLLNFTNRKLEQIDLDKEYNQSAIDYLHSVVLESFDLHSLKQEFLYHLESYDKDENRSAKQSFFEQAKEINIKLLPIIEVAEKFQKQLSQIIVNKGTNEQLKDRIKSAINYFEPLIQEISKDIFAIISEIDGVRGVKQYNNELRNLESLFFNRLQKMKKSMLLIDAIISNSNIKKENLLPQSVIKERQDLTATKYNPSRKKKSNITSEKLPKSEKRDTKEITFEMFSKGMTVKEIAKERGFIEMTIEGHLSYYVAEGLIDIKEFVNNEKIKLVTDVYSKLKTKSLKEIKDNLTEDLNYAEIKLIMAHLEFSGQL